MRACLRQTGNKQTTTTKSQAKQKISGSLLWGYSDLLLCPASVLLTWPFLPLHPLPRVRQASWLSGSFSPFNQMAQLVEPSLAGVHNTRATGRLCRGAGGGCRGPVVVQTQVSAKQILSTLLLPPPPFFSHTSPQPAKIHRVQLVRGAPVPPLLPPSESLARESSRCECTNQIQEKWLPHLPRNVIIPLLIY